MRTEENGNMIEAYDKKQECSPMFTIGWQEMTRNDETGHFIEVFESDFCGHLLMNINEAKAVVKAINKALKEIETGEVIDD